MRYGYAFCLSLFLALIMSACETSIPKEALEITPETLEFRHLQTRRFDTTDERFLLSASAGMLQDLGFNIDEAETDLGVLVASKDRDATEADQVAGAIVLALITGVAIAVDDIQKMRVSIVTNPKFDENNSHVSTGVRVTFQRVVWDTNGQISQVEALREPEMYQEFFFNLSKSVFLEAHEI